MKTPLHLLFLLLGLAIITQSRAQTINVTAYDSLHGYCPLPVTVPISVNGSATGYDYTTDVITVEVFWGDGSSTVYNCDLFYGGTMDYFYETPTHTYTLPGVYTPMVIATGPDGTDDTTYCSSLNLSAGCVPISGYTYQDNNSNCIFDLGDDALEGVFVYVYDPIAGNTIGTAISNTSGYYEIYVLSGLSSLQIHTVSYGSTTVCPVGGLYIFSSSGAASFDFALACGSSDVDYYVHHTGVCNFGVPGGLGTLSLNAGVSACYSTTGYPATITVTLDPLVTYAGMIYGPAPSSISGGGSVLTWNTTLYGGGFFTDLDLSFNILTSTSATVLSPSCFDLSITGSSTDVYLGNNHENTCLFIGGPYDPNNKEVMPAGIGAAGNVAPETVFNYLVNFQNTGTAPAINVYIMDTLDSDLDMNTLQITGASHDMNPIFTGANIVRFDFPNINLIDSVANEPLSHGWVTYSVKAKSGLAHGTEITNTAHIYFDYNAPIVTNTTLNTIDITLGVDELTTDVLNNVLYPNPASNMFTLQFEDAVSGSIQLYDTKGTLVLAQVVNNQTAVTLSTQNLQNGFYAITMPGQVLKQNRIQIIK